MPRRKISVERLAKRLAKKRKEFMQTIKTLGKDL